MSCQAARVTRLWTIGYERLMPEALVAELRAAGVRRVLDVRFRPQSRRPGMSKTRLGALLGEHGIAYESRRGLGTPPDLRFLYRSGQIAEARPASAGTSRPTRPTSSTRSRPSWPPRRATALLCLEADPAHCHRRVVAEALARRRPDLAVIDL